MAAWSRANFNCSSFYLFSGHIFSPYDDFTYKKENHNLFLKERLNNEQLGISEQLCDDQKGTYYKVRLYLDIEPEILDFEVHF